MTYFANTFSIHNLIFKDYFTFMIYLQDLILKTFSNKLDKSEFPQSKSKA